MREVVAQGLDERLVGDAEVLVAAARQHQMPPGDGPGEFGGQARLPDARLAGQQDLAGVELVAAEVYPSMLKPVPAAGEVKDLAQVRAMAEHFARLDEAGKLGALFGASKTAPADVVRDAEHEEGWILGTAI